MNVVGVVLAAGFGTRLRPSTALVPKPLIPVGGIEPLYFALYKAYDLGIRRFVVNAHHLSDQVQNSLTSWTSHFPGAEFRVSVEVPEILGTGGGILKIIQDHPDWFKNAGLLLQNGDTLGEFDLAELIGDQRESTLAVSFFTGHLQKYNPLWIDENSLWSGIGKKSPTAASRPAHFLGVHFLSAKAVALLSNSALHKVEVTDLFNGIYRPLTLESLDFRARPFVFDGVAGRKNFWFDMTSSDFLLEAQHYVLSTLVDKGLWTRILKHRYPKIHEISPGIWSTHQKKEIKFLAPAIWVEGQHQKTSLSCPPCVVGPHASFICERGRMEQKSDAIERKISNSVVFVSQDKNLELSHDLSGQLCVV